MSSTAWRPSASSSLLPPTSAECVLTPTATPLTSQAASRKSRADAVKANSSAQELSSKLAAFGH